MPAKLPQPSHAPEGSVAARVAAIPLLTPPECDARLLALGYRGQPHARRAASVLAYRHVRRLRRAILDHLSPEALGPRENYMFIGPTGSGKTFLVELLFRDILAVPTVTVDITQYSETGYVGDDVNMILSRLFEASDQDLEWAACGVVCLDEFDKLASSRSSARFAGEGTTKDVSGFGVQRGLLTLLAGTEAPFPVDFGYAQMGPKLTLPLHNVSFIACGAFSGLKTTAQLMGDTERIGFGRDAQPVSPEAIAVKLEDEILEQTPAFARYGFLPELIGRFSRVVAFAPLDAETLRSILVDGVLTAYVREFADEGLELTASDAVLDHMVERAVKRELGARGLRAALVPHLEDAAYTCFGRARGGRVRLELEGGAVVVRAN
jgi:ATP-dependent Clp protease ATP-binding subunit ClpX